jgi:hypothetical protein
VKLEDSQVTTKLNQYLLEMMATAHVQEEDLLSEEDGESVLIPFIKAQRLLGKMRATEFQNAVVQASSTWVPLREVTDVRLPGGYYSGGLALTDPATLEKLRKVGKELIYRIGKKLLSGSLNLTTISFPIVCMQANTALHNCLKAAGLCPLYLTKAALSNDYVERMKLVVAATICSFAYTSTFLKPVKLT